MERAKTLAADPELEYQLQLGFSVDQSSNLSRYSSAG